MPPDTDHHDSAQLIEGAARGDTAAVESLLVRHLPRVRAYLRLRCGAKVRAQESVSDLAQSVCREALVDLHGFEYRSEGAFLSWLFQKAISKLRDRGRYYAAQKRDVAREEPASLHRLQEQYRTIITPSRVADGREQVERVERAFDELPEEYREALTMRRIGGLSHEEVGEALGKSASAARSICDRALRRLSWILSREPQDE